MAEISAHDTRRVFFLLSDSSYAWGIQGGWSCMDRCGDIGILVFLFFIFFQLQGMRSAVFVDGQAKFIDVYIRETYFGVKWCK